jgi:hypothetical protein
MSCYSPLSALSLTHSCVSLTQLRQQWHSHPPHFTFRSPLVQSGPLVAWMSADIIHISTAHRCCYDATGKQRRHAWNASSISMSRIHLISEPTPSGSASQLMRSGLKTSSSFCHNAMGILLWHVVSHVLTYRFQNNCYKKPTASSDLSWVTTCPR